MHSAYSDDSSRSFFVDMLRHLAAATPPADRSAGPRTSRTYAASTSATEDQSTESGVAMSHHQGDDLDDNDDSAEALLYEVRSQPTSDDLCRQLDTIHALVKFIKVCHFWLFWNVPILFFTQYNIIYSNRFFMSVVILYYINVIIIIIAFDLV